jgi:hypothetical protein
MHVTETQMCDGATHHTLEEKTVHQNNFKTPDDDQ